MVWHKHTHDDNRPPKMTSIPFFGNIASMISNPLQFMVESYHEYGAAYRAVVLGREVYVIAGLEANRLLATADENIISKSGFYGGLATEFGDTNYFTASDGDSYKELRAEARAGYSRQRAANLIPTIVEMTRERIQQWAFNTELNVIQHFEKLIADLIGFVIVNSPASAVHEDYRRIIETLMLVHAARIWHRLMLNMPRYKTSLQTGYDFAAQMIAWHREHPPVNRHRDYVAANAAENPPQPYPYQCRPLTVSLPVPESSSRRGVARSHRAHPANRQSNPDVC